ncbi:MAG: prepilin peptidase, partial [Candidatus Gastranaerophilales bacterium]|nr:prepilin peptidase [Candidatus Gastranaerophilales bacterium]
MVGELEFYNLFFVIIIGCVIGSFLNVVGLRLLSEESIVFPPSKCPNCQTRLSWRDNIPIFGYILLLGKCRYCKKPISIQYPLIELFTGIIFGLTYFYFGFTLNALFLLFLSCSLIVII